MVWRGAFWINHIRHKNRHPPYYKQSFKQVETRTISSLYETFDPKTAFELAQRLEIHNTPKHGSWLNIAEIEQSAVTTQCLNRRIANIEELQKQISLWETQRNKSQKA